MMTILSIIQYQPHSIASLSASVFFGHFFLGGIVMYLLPGVIALVRSHRNAAAIMVLNIFLGWTFIGWIACLVWACTNPAPVYVRQ